jgi:exopolysaccharide production protein ExoQ
MSSAVLANPVCPVQSPRTIAWTTALASLFVAAMFYVADQDWRFSELDLSEEVMESSTVEGNPMRRLGLLALGAVGAALVIRPGGQALRARGVLAWLCVAFALWSTASLLWAVDRGVVFRRLFADGCLVAAALAAAKWISLRQLAWIALLCTGGVLLVGLAAELSLGLFHPTDAEYRFSGTMHPNDQGMQRAVMCLAALYLSRGAGRGRPLLLCAAAVGFGFLLLTKSRASLAAVLVATAALQWTTASARARIGWVLAAVFLASWGMLLSDGRMADSAAEAFLLGREDSEAATFTGRTPLWEELWNYVQQRPLWGHGYDGFWTPPHIAEVSSSQGWAIAVGHSAYLDLLLGIGAAGLALGLPIVVLAIAQAARREQLWPGKGYGFVLAVLVLCLCDGVLESNVLLPRFVPLVAMTGMAMLAFQPWPLGEGMKDEG